jgi:hypothetical protein
MRFPPEVPIAGDETRFVERTIRIAPLPAPEAGAARAAILAAIPARPGRVIWSKRRAISAMLGRIRRCSTR